MPKLCPSQSFKGHGPDPSRGTRQLQVRGVEGGLGPPPHLASAESFAREREVWETAGTFAQVRPQAPLIAPSARPRVRVPRRGGAHRTRSAAGGGADSAQSQFFPLPQPGGVGLRVGALGGPTHRSSLGGVGDDEAERAGRGGWSSSCGWGRGGAARAAGNREEVGRSVPHPGTPAAEAALCLRSSV